MGGTISEKAKRSQKPQGRIQIESQRDGRVAEATLLIRTVTRLGAQVAPQQSLVFRAGEVLTTTNGRRIQIALRLAV